MVSKRVYYALQDFSLDNDYVELGRVVCVQTSNKLDLSTSDKHPSLMQTLLAEGKVAFKVANDEDITECYTGNLYVENDEIKKDSEFNVRLMKTAYLKQKLLDKNQLKLNEELKKEVKDNAKVFELVTEKEMLKINETPKDIYQLGLAGLDERVANGESDKPIIRQKLEAKILELSGSVPEMVPDDKKDN